MSIMNEMVAYIKETTFEDLPQEAISKAKEGVIDFLGCTLVGSKNETGKIILDYVKSLSAKSESTVIGGGFKTSLALAALANGTFSHADDYDDISFSLPGHPSVTILPAVFSIGEMHDITGEALLTAYLIAFEIECKLGQALAPKLYQNGWHATPVLGCLGGAAAAGKLLDLSEAQLAHCLGIAGSMASGLRANLGTMTKPFHAGIAAQNGVTAALLAQQGLTASSAALDGQLGYCQSFAGGAVQEKIIGKLGNPYDIITPGIIFKQYPSCAETHPALDATIALAEEYSPQPQDIASIDCVVTPLNDDVLIYSSPKTALEGKFSLHFCAALGLLKRKASLHEFVDELVSDPEMIALMKKVTMTPDPSLAEDGYTGAATIVTMRMNDGNTYTKRVDHAKGSPENPLNMEELLAKYRDCAGSLLSPEAREKSIECLLDIENLDQVGTLMSIIDTQTQ
jgi:2-methylcitrate dehydratase PrpD